MGAIRVPHERLVLEKLEAALGDLPGVIVAKGLGSTNRFPIEGWGLSTLQLFQFGDFRLQTSTTDVVVEAESAGGVTNLAKYWPLLAAGPRERRFVLVHLFQIATPGDYIAHRHLWDYLVIRMREDLDRRCNVRWGEHWEARLFTYSPVDATLSDVIAYVRAAAATG